MCEIKITQKRHTSIYLQHTRFVIAFSKPREKLGVRRSILSLYCSVRVSADLDWKECVCIYLCVCVCVYSTLSIKNGFPRQQLPRKFKRSKKPCSILSIRFSLMRKLSHLPAEPEFIIFYEAQELIPPAYVARQNQFRYDTPICRTGSPGYICWRNRFLGSYNDKFGLAYLKWGNRVEGK
jgi:hypothetical protein